jgi:hypothetical protein
MYQRLKAVKQWHLTIFSSGHEYSCLDVLMIWDIFPNGKPTTTGELNQGMFFFGSLNPSIG